MTGRERCDEIIRLIDEVLADLTATPRPVLEPARVPARRPVPAGTGR
ncbi:MAG TPA: hypothetical protein VFH58_15150 [Acidimicrobiales bacterium]|nr:hypothetical protein [Acidimicrobiales bacterium]